MNDDLYGVLFRDQGVQKYLVFADESEETAERRARRRDELAFDDAVEKHADEPDEFAEPVWEDTTAGTMSSPSRASLQRTQSRCWLVTWLW
jgi:hypothetical protein